MIAAKDKRSTGDKNRSMIVSSSSVTATDKSEKDRSATIKAVVKSLQFSSPVPAIVGDVHFPANRSNANANADFNGAAAVTRIFDHNGDPI